jgi:hypothetical protein
LKKLLFSLFITLLCVNAHASTISRTNIVSWDGLTVAGYNTDLNTVYTKVNSGIYSANIVDGTIALADLSPAARLDYYQSESIGNYVYTGLTLPTSGLIGVATISSGTAYISGIRVLMSATVVNTIDGWAVGTNYIFLNSNSTYKARNTATPLANEIYIGSIVANATDVTSASETGRQTYPPALRIYLDLKHGMVISADAADASAIQISEGAIEFGNTVDNGYRRNNTATKVDLSVSGLGGLDTGAAAANTYYYVYAIASTANAANWQGFLSTNSADSASYSDERLIGWFYSALAGVVSRDQYGAWRGKGGDAPNVAQAIGDTDIGTASTSLIEMPGMNCRFVACGHRPVRVTASFSIDGAGDAAFDIQMDGNTIVSALNEQTTNVADHTHMSVVVYPSAGTHLFTVRWKSSGGSTITQAGATYRRVLIVEEL